MSIEKRAGGVVEAVREFAPALTGELIHDAPEELANVTLGFAPRSDRARDPGLAYKTKIHLVR